MDRCRESQGSTSACSVVCPNVTGRTNERIAQSKRVHGVLVRSPSLISHKWRQLIDILRADIVVSFSGVICFSCFCFVFVFPFFIKAVALCSVVPQYAYAPAAIHSYLTTLSVSFFVSLFLVFVWRSDALSSILVPLTTYLLEI